MPKKSPDAEAVPALVARLAPVPPPQARVNGGPPKLNNISQADIDKLNSNRSIEQRIMNERNGWGPTPSERNRAGGPPSFASLNEGLTFTAIAASPYSGSAYMKSRRVG
jgi:hypothetical protein